MGAMKNSVLAAISQRRLPPGAIFRCGPDGVDTIGESSITLTTGTFSDIMAASWAFPNTAAVSTANTAMGGGVFLDAGGTPIVRYGYEWYVLANSTCLWFGAKGIVIYSTSQAENANKITRYLGDFSTAQRALLPNSGTTFVGGIPQSKFQISDGVLYFGEGTPFAGDTGGTTVIIDNISRRCRQDGVLRGINIQITQLYAPGVIKAKVFRKVGSDYEFVAESNAVPITSFGLKNILFTAMPQCQQGDVLGIYLPGPALSAFKIRTTITGDGAPAALKTAVGDITTTNTFSTSILNLALNIEFIISKPFIAVTGDSIEEGWGDGIWNGIYTGLDGDLNGEIMHNMSALMAADGVRFGNYQNHADGGMTWAWVRSTGIVSAIASGAKVILVRAGINDIIAGRTWAQVEADMDACAALLTAGQQLVIGDILPWTNGTDLQAATIRTWNSNSALWCANNDALFIQSHDDMGQIRISTGELDDLKTDPDYNRDNIHLTNLGVQRMAVLRRDALYAHYGISV